MTRGGREKDQDEPERKCIVSGESQPKGGLIRFVVGPDAMVVPDVLGRLPGRGMYVAADRKAIDKAAAKGLFSRAARQPVKAPDGLSDLIEAQLLRRVLDTLSMARKAGEAVTGYEKVKEWLVKGRARVLIQASDGSERGKTKLHPPEGEGGFIGCLSSGELGLAFGRERAIHAALAAGGLGQRVVEEAARLAGVRGHVGGISAGEDTKTA
ncbi:RNA-binding protein [Rhodobacteraceae bacterium HSP-20]|uniref:RNA-binding protein n=1 Tax=Paragemmobacter amnigenus TaxID=2852097 RepID=A0ABS6J3A7_9RHOB|nr:RNA-binding protein [Rhodobacter amnigenus]MBU9698002.1 RNA-binding protein [Rhodobacter amnigenus]MBV4389229.1 RNA-binding protein [Rhodobacter amnigenus]